MRHTRPFYAFFDVRSLGVRRQFESKTLRKLAMLGRWKSGRSKGPKDMRGDQQRTSAQLAKEIEDLHRENEVLRARNNKLKARLAELGGGHVFEQRYRGKAAQSYDEKRAGHGMWRREDKAVARFLSQMPENTRVLDVPVGTGRFVPHYAERKMLSVGIDTSEDMLALAREKCDAIGYEMELLTGNVMSLPYEDKAFDCTICVRLLNFFTEVELKQAVAEISRVSKSWLILTIRLNDNIHKPMQSETKKTIVHPVSDLLNLIAANDFDIVERTVIDQRNENINYIVLARRRNA